MSTIKQSIFIADMPLLFNNNQQLCISYEELFEYPRYQTLFDMNWLYESSESYEKTIQNENIANFVQNFA